MKEKQKCKPQLSLHPPALPYTPVATAPICPLNVRIKWGDHLNGSWLQESSQAVVLRETTLPLYDRLLQNKVCQLYLLKYIFIVLIYRLIDTM